MFLISDLYDWLLSFLGDHDADVSTDNADAIDYNTEEGQDIDQNSDNSQYDYTANENTIEKNITGDSVDKMLNNGISPNSINDKELAELDQTSFEGHTACSCNICSCTHYIPSSDPKYCTCGHKETQHKWIS